MSFDLVALLEYLNLNGWSAITALLILFLIWMLFSNNKVSEKIRIRILKTFSESSSTLHLEKERIAEKTSSEIDEVLDRLQHETGATNVLYVRFHNGKYDRIGSSIIKFSAANEKAKSGYFQIGTNIQDISRSLHGKFCDYLIKNKKVYIKDKDSIKENKEELIGLMNTFGNAEKFYAYSVTTIHEGEIMGFVCLVYIEPLDIDEEKIDLLLHDASSRVAAIVEIGNKMSDTLKQKRFSKKS